MLYLTEEEKKKQLRDIFCEITQSPEFTAFYEAACNLDCFLLKKNYYFIDPLFPITVNVSDKMVLQLRPPTFLQGDGEEE